MVFPNHCLTMENKDVNIDYYIPIIGKKDNDLIITTLASFSEAAREPLFLS